MIAHAVREHDRKTPSDAALTFQQAPGQVERWSYQQLSWHIDQLIDGLSGKRCDDEPVALVMTAEGESVAALLAAEELGLPSLLLPAGLPAGEARMLLEESGISLLFVPTGALGWTSAVLRDSGAGWIAVGSLEDASPLSALLPRDGICQLTSGSTGASRLAVRAWEGVQVELEAVCERASIGADDTVLSTGSIAHSYSLMGGVLAPLLAGAEAVLGANAADSSRLAEQVQPTLIFGLPATYQVMLQRPTTDVALQRARLALSAGAPLPAGLFEAFARRFRLPIRQDYGTTETGTLTIDTSAEVQEGCAGEPLPHLQLRLAKPEDIPLNGAETGEIQVRGAATARAYLSGRELIPCRDEDGWYHTGDAGFFDASQRLWVGRRLRPAIRLAGVDVRPETVESVIQALPGVRDAVALAIHDSQGRAAIKAVVVAPGLEMGEIEDWCRRQLPPDHQPAVLELREQLPRSPAGKILQKYLVCDES